MRPSPPGMVLNLPAHTQRQLANMAAAPAPAPAVDASPMDQYRLTMAQRYRQQIQLIMNADALAQDPDAITAAPLPAISVSAASTPSSPVAPVTNAMLTADFDLDDDVSDDDELLPPYEEEDNASDCTITVQEIDSPDTPSDDATLGSNHFFDSYSPAQETTTVAAAAAAVRPNSASSEPTAIVQVAFSPPKQLGRARALTLTKKGAVSVVEKPASREHSFLRPRSRSNSAGSTTKNESKPPRNSKVRRQLASIFGSKAHDHHHHHGAAAVRSSAVL